MVAIAKSFWNPNCIRRIVQTYPTGSEVVEVVTDTGPGFAKFLGGKEGPHVLACEWIGTRLAGLLGLATFDYAIFDYDGVPEIELASGNQAQKGPTWITRREAGFPWSGDADDLKLLANPGDLAGLVVLDTWTLNCDRYCPALQPTRINRNNVFFARRDSEAHLTLLAMDHTHILTCGRELTPKLAGIDRVKSEDIYGLFPEFPPLIDSATIHEYCRRMAAISNDAIRQIVLDLPAQWLGDDALREVLFRFLTGRRDYLASDLATRIVPQAELPFPTEE
jgi:hypothetical protein